MVTKQIRINSEVMTKRRPVPKIHKTHDRSDEDDVE